LHGRRNRPARGRIPPLLASCRPRSLPEKAQRFRVSPPQPGPPAGATRIVALSTITELDASGCRVKTFFVPARNKSSYAKTFIRPSKIGWRAINRSCKTLLLMPAKRCHRVQRPSQLERRACGKGILDGPFSAALKLVSLDYVGADMDPRKSAFDFVFVSRLIKSSIASTVESGLSTFRRTHTRLNSSGGRSSSSLRVPDR